MAAQLVIRVTKLTKERRKTKEVKKTRIPWLTLGEVVNLVRIKFPEILSVIHSFASLSNNVTVIGVYA